MHNNTIYAHTALLLANILYAANYTIAKWVMPQYIKPFGFIFIRVLGALIFFWSISFFLPRQHIAKSDFLRLFLCGMFGVAINQLMFFAGLNLTKPINASLIMVTTPILVILIAIASKKESFAWATALGVTLGAIGAISLIFNKSFSFEQSTILGDLFVFINACSYAIYLSIVKPLMSKYNALTIIKWVFFFGFIPVFFFGYSEFKEIQWSLFSSKILWSVVYVVIGVTCMAYLLNVYALKKVNPSIVGIYIYLQPLLAAFIAFYLKADEFTLTKIAAAILIFLGVYFVSFYPKKRI